MQDILSATLARFPARRREIEELASSSDSFRGLCEELKEAMIALQRWERGGSPKDAQRAVEYRALIESLVSEVASALDSARPSSPSPHPTPEGANR